MIKMTMTIPTQRGWTCCRGRMMNYLSEFGQILHFTWIFSILQWSFLEVRKTLTFKLRSHLTCKFPDYIVLNTSQKEVMPQHMFQFLNQVNLMSFVLKVDRTCHQVHQLHWVEWIALINNQKKGAVRWYIVVYIVGYRTAPVEAKPENALQLRTSNFLRRAKYICLSAAGDASWFASIFACQIFHQKIGNI